MATVSKDQENPTWASMLPIISASTIGTAIEWYDFFVYNTIATIVFPALFFPKADYLAGLLLTFTANYFGFLARPIGGAFFGHLGDRIGRKSTLVITLLFMGIATTLVGLMPVYAQIGVAAPIIVTVLRFCQGFGVGGEWGGSVLLSMEHGHKSKRGFWAGWPQAGVPIGLVLSTAVVALFHFIYPGEVVNTPFFTIGWRIPFLLSALLIIVGLYIRLRILETPLFAKVLAEKREAKAPLIDAFRYHWKEIILTAFVRFGEQGPFYVFTVFVIAYVTKTLKLSSSTALIAISVAGILALATIPTFGYLSDRVGRRTWYAAGSIVMALYAFPYFWLLNTGNIFLIILSTVLAVSIAHPLLYGPQAALISERFSTRVRYSGSSLGYQLASIAGGASPIIAAALLGPYGYNGIALYIAILAVISLISVLLLKDFTQTDISTDAVYGLEEATPATAAPAD